VSVARELEKSSRRRQADDQKVAYISSASAERSPTDAEDRTSRWVALARDTAWKDCRHDPRVARTAPAGRADHARGGEAEGARTISMLERCRAVDLITRCCRRLDGAMLVACVI